MAVDVDWQHWRVTSHGLTWRVATPEDKPAIENLQDDMEFRLGPQSTPDLFSSPVIITLVAENESGEVVDGLYVECIAEIHKIAYTRAGLQSSEALIPDLHRFLYGRKFRRVRTHVPRMLRRVMWPILRSMFFNPTDESFAHFEYTIRD